LLLRERQPPLFIVRRIAADSQLDRRNAEIPSAEFCHRQIEADARVDDAVIVSKRRADVALDDKDRVRFRIDTVCGRLALLRAEIDQVEIHRVESTNLKQWKEYIAAG